MSIDELSWNLRRKARKHLDAGGNCAAFPRKLALKINQQLDKKYKKKAE